VSLRRPFIWKCDEPGCNAVVEREGYGMPKGWVWHRKLEEPVKHRCEECEKRRKEEAAK